MTDLEKHISEGNIWVEDGYYAALASDGIVMLGRVGAEDNLNDLNHIRHLSIGKMKSYVLNELS